MRSRFGWGRAIALFLLLAFVAIVVGIALAWSALPLDHTKITIDDETIQLSGIDGWRVALVVVAVSAGILIALIAGALAVVFGLLAAALSTAVALVFVVATLALVASPVLIIVWAIWRLSRSPDQGRTATA